MSTRPERMRSMLFAPGNRPDVCAKLPRCRPDAAVLDLEDAVPPQLRVEARALVRNQGAELARAHPEISWYVRVNAVASEWFAGDIADALGPELDGVVLPKVDTVDQITEAADALARAGLAHLHVLVGLETALGVADARTILDQPAVVATYFGAEDYIADIGGVRTPSSAETLYARSRVALAARLAGALALDQVVTSLNDEDAFLADARAPGAPWDSEASSASTPTRFPSHSACSLRHPMTSSAPAGSSPHTTTRPRRATPPSRSKAR